MNQKRQFNEKEAFETIHSSLDWNLEKEVLKIYASPKLDFGFISCHTNSINTYIQDIKAPHKDVHVDFGKVSDLEKGVLSAYVSASSKKAKKEDSKLLISGITKTQEEWLKQTLADNVDFEVVSYKEKKPKLPSIVSGSKKDNKKPKKLSGIKKIVGIATLAIAAGIGAYRLNDGRILPKLYSSDYRYEMTANVLKMYKKTNDTAFYDKTIIIPHEYLRISKTLESAEKCPKGSRSDDLYERLLKFHKEFKEISPSHKTFELLKPKERYFAAKAFNAYLAYHLDRAIERLRPR